MMRKTKILLMLVMTVLAISYSTVNAAFDPLGEVCDGATSGSEVCQADASDPIATNDGVLIRVVNLLSWVIGAASVIMVLLGGLKYVTANGDPNAISSAKNTILFALIGVALSIFSRVIIIFVLQRSVT